MRRQRTAGFTLLEVVVAMAVLALALMAIFDLNAGAVAMHAYAKKVTVATLLARSKMTDLEQELYDKGFPADDDEQDGDFSDEGFESFKWRAKIIAPNTQDVSPEQLVGAIFNVPAGEGAIGALFGGAPSDGKDGPLPGAGGGLAGGMAGGMAQAQMTQFLEQIRQSVREVHLTVTWKDGKLVESVDLVTHVVSLGPGSDRNGQGSTPGSPSASAGETMVNARTGAPVPNPGQDPSGRLVDPSNPFDTLVPLSQYQAMQAQRQQQGAPASRGPFGGFNPGAGMFGSKR